MDGGTVETKMRSKLLTNETIRKRLAKAIALNCFRNTELENLHAGISPSTKTGNYSDVKVVTPYGEIPWKNLSRFSDAEMKVLMIDVVDTTYTLLTMFAQSPSFRKDILKALEKRDFEPTWNEPKYRNYSK